MQMGRHAARNVLRRARGEPALPFGFVDKGMMAEIGRNAAVAEVGRLRLSGFLGWAAWLVVHVFFLIGFRNKLLVLIEWAWAYATYNRGVRLITGG
jgi:NADH dehydrogenase